MSIFLSLASSRCSQLLNIKWQVQSRYHQKNLYKPKRCEMRRWWWRSGWFDGFEARANDMLWKGRANLNKQSFISQTYAFTAWNFFLSFFLILLRYVKSRAACGQSAFVLLHKHIYIFKTSLFLQTHITVLFSSSFEYLLLLLSHPFGSYISKMFVVSWPTWERVLTWIKKVSGSFYAVQELNIRGIIFMEILWFWEIFWAVFKKLKFTYLKVTIPWIN